MRYTLPSPYRPRPAVETVCSGVRRADVATGCLRVEVQDMGEIYLTITAEVQATLVWPGDLELVEVLHGWVIVGAVDLPDSAEDHLLAWTLAHGQVPAVDPVLRRLIEKHGGWQSAEFRRLFEVQP